jgi:hypothetical protein
VTLKLYQPAHQRYYLVAANLVCRVPGFPDHTIAMGGGDQIGFMLRRLLPESDSASAPSHEYAFVKDARGPHWERVPRDEQSPDGYARSVPNEEMLPLFPLNFVDDIGHFRRLLAGLVPVGRREEYMGSMRYETALATSAAPAPVATDPGVVAKTKKSARKEQLKLDVTEPWKALIRAMYKAAERIDTGNPEGSILTQRQQRRKSAKETNEGAQLQSWLILLDFADYLRNHVPEVWAAVISTTPQPTLTDDGKRRLFQWINGNSNALSNNAADNPWASDPAPGAGWQLTGAARASNMRDALKRINEPGVRDRLEGAERTFVASKVGVNPWPNFYYLLAGVYEAQSRSFSAEGVQDSLTSASAPALDPDDLEANPPRSAAEIAAQPNDAETAAARVDKLVQLVMAAVDADAETPAPPVPFAAQLRDAIASTSGDPGWFVIRCAYARRDCGPQATVLSVPSQKFQLASFFDSDAPARPIRIALPTDTTPAGMRKHQKNTAFVLSDVLCGQVNRLKGLGFVDLVLSVLPWPFHKDLNIGSEGLGPCKRGDVEIGMICSLSIPIITICALILLFMIVLVLDLIFKWIPWFILCWPLPKFKAKKATT